jgi:FkbM family methyltransferase
MVGARGRIVAFEPTDFAFRRLLRNLELNPDISDRVTPEIAYLDDGQRGGSPPSAFYASWRLEATPGQHPRHFGSLQAAGHAAAWTLDDYSRNNDLGQVGLIKLDVDGFECRVLRGAARLLERDHPAIVAEICPYALEEHGDSAEEMLGILSSHGYSFYDERTFRQLTSDPRQLKASIKQYSSINVVALAHPAASPTVVRGASIRP